MKFIVFSDLHIHNYKKFDVDGSRLDNCIRVLHDVTDIAIELNIEHVLFVGDLFDQQKSVPTEVLVRTFMAFEDIFKRSNISFYAISGNHDMYSKNTNDEYNESSIVPLAVAFERFHVLDNSTKIVNGIRISGVPYYQHPEHFNNAIKDLRSDILLIHQTPEHSNPMIQPDCSSKDFSRFKHTFCGHIHKHEVVQSYFTIVGSPLHRDLGDEGQDKGILIYDYDNDSFERVILDYPKFMRTNENMPNDYVIPIIETSSTESVDAPDIHFNNDWKENTLAYMKSQDKDSKFFSAFNSLIKDIA